MAGNTTPLATPVTGPGANDPLAQLPPLAEPVAIGTWPLAPGWWLLALLCIALLTTGIWLAAGYWQRRRFIRAARREAMKSYARYCSDSNTVAYLQRSNALLRRTCIAYWPDQALQRRQGRSWLESLDELSSTELFSNTTGEQLLHAYAPAADCDAEQLHKLILRWLDALRPPARQARHAPAKTNVGSRRRV